MASHSDRLPPANERGRDVTSELVLKIHRCVMAGLCLGDTSSWDFGWRSLSKAAPSEEVGPLFGQFYGFGRALLAAAQNPFICRPLSYCGNDAEEALALRIIETAQRADHPGMLSAASALLGVDDLGGVLQTAQSLAGALARHGLLVRSHLERDESPLPGVRGIDMQCEAQPS
jgi:hypothetical protein